jgi:putative heme transporter
VIIGISALRRHRSRKAIVRIGGRLVGISRRLGGQPVGDPEDVAQRTVDTLFAFRMRPREWERIVRLSCVNWLASVGCLVASILAVGANVPWSKVIIVYCAGATASSLNVTPGGLGVTEAVLSAGLVASGLRPAEALGSALVFRFVSFWLVALIGWIIYSELRREKRASRVDPLFRSPWGKKRGRRG